MTNSMYLFDICIITVSTEKQAEAVRELIRRRVVAGLYPKELDFRVYADPEGCSLGSGGSTLWAICSLLHDEGISFRECGRFVAGKSILMIHAGGDFDRLPIYAPEGRLFVPVPVPSSAILPPVVLDLQLALFFRYPWREGELLVLPGDVVAQFDPDLMPALDGSIFGFAKHATFAQGAKHGVFTFDPTTGAVIDYHQKAPESFLAEKARIEGTDECALDIGLVSLRTPFIEALVGFGTRRENDPQIKEELPEHKDSFDLYSELMIACLPSLDWERYQKRIGNSTRLQAGRLKFLYETFSVFELRGVVTRSAEFIHIGSIEDYADACRVIVQDGWAPFYANPYEELPPEVSQGSIRHNCLDVDVSGESNTLENCSVVQAGTQGGCVFAGIESWSPEYLIPARFCVEERVLTDAIGDVRIRLVYSFMDTFRDGTSLEEIIFCGMPIAQWLREREMGESDVWDRYDHHCLCDAKIFSPVASDEFFEGYWKRPRNPVAWKAEFLNATRYSIRDLNSFASLLSRDESRGKKRQELLRRKLISGRGFRSIAERDFSTIVSSAPEYAILRTVLERTDDPLLKLYRAALLRKADRAASALQQESFRISFTKMGGPSAPLRIKVKEDQIVWARAPIRFDLAGGWSDTPPYTNRYGGQIVNVAADLNGQSPVQVFVRRTRDPYIQIHSIDLGITETIRMASGILDYRDPSSPYALPKAALALLGVGSGLKPNDPLAPYLAETGGGLEVTLLCAVPKGSGLGTSSILAGTILAALERFYGIAIVHDELFLQVLEMEQMLTTGGGWQDQIGGLVGGIKFLESKPSVRPSPTVYQLDPFLFEDPRSRATMTLFYTGITRLAKNILQDVVSRVNGMTPAYLFTHRCLKMLALEAREAIALRDRLRLAKVIAASFRENTLIHESTTNEEMEIFIRKTRPWYVGMKLLGAGGGGFALFISQTQEQADELKTILAREYEHDRARLVDFSLNKQGLVVTVS